MSKPIARLKRIRACDARKHRCQRRKEIRSRNQKKKAGWVKNTWTKLGWTKV